MTNPLQGFYRTPKTYTQIPSQGMFYTPDIIEMTPETREVGIKAMTSQDEMLFKNPEALLNGEAVINALKSCVVGIGDVKKLLSNDVDALLVAIRIASFGDDMDVTIACPECKEENTFGFNLNSCLSNMSFLEESYDIYLDNGLRVNIRPHLYSDTLKSLMSAFEQSKIIKSLDDSNKTEEERLKLFTKSFKHLVSLNFEVFCNSINFIAHEAEGIHIENNMKNRADILDFLKNIDKTESDKIQEKISEVNSKGINKSTHATCSKCSHEWDSKIEIDPVVFFSGS